MLGLMMLVNARGGSSVSMDWRAGSWYVPWLGGLALASWLGDYGHGRGVLHFGSSIPILFVFSVLVYWMAYAVRLRRPVVLDNIELVKAEAVAEEAELGELPA